jgi:plastocyanin
MANSQFQPVKVAVAAGGTVTWTNTDVVPHTVTAEDGSFDSGILRSGEVFSHRFDTAGTYAYSCILHQGMSGEVDVVSDSGGGATGASQPGTVAQSTASPADPSSGAGASSNVVISIDDETFPPVTLVALGGTITWVNNDDVDHNVIAGDGSFTSEKFMPPGDQFSHTFDQPGAYPYQCDIHQHMRGLVIVTATAGGAETAPEVDVTDIGFAPSKLTVHQGDTVVWRFGGSLPHTVTAADGSFDSGILKPGATFSQTFDTLGTFDYSCILHPAMIGTITVVPPDEQISDEPSGQAELGVGSPGNGTSSGSGDSGGALMLLWLALGVVGGLGSGAIIAALTIARRHAGSGLRPASG